MARLSIDQIRGLKDLIQETIDGATSAIEETHQAIARQPFALLERIETIAVPVRAIGQVQQAVTGGVYDAIRAINRITGALATQALGRLEEHGNTARTDSGTGSVAQYPALSAPRRRLSE